MRSTLTGSVVGMRRFSFGKLARLPYVQCIFAFSLTVSVARLISYFRPHAHWEAQQGIHIHHFTFGIFALAIGGYLALVFKGSRASFFIALLHGFGLGLTFDEFAMWINLREGEFYRWNNIGLIIVVGTFLMGLVVVSLVKRRSRLSQPGTLLSINGDAEASAD